MNNPGANRGLTLKTMAIATDLVQACNSAFRAGLAEVYITETCNITSMTASTTAHSFTAITMVSLQEFFKFEGMQNGMDLVVDGSENGTVNITANITFEGFTAASLFALQAVVNARKVTAVLVSSNLAGTNPRAYVIGFDSIVNNAAYMKPRLSGKIESSLFEGLYDVTLTLSGTQAEFPREIIGDIAYNSATVTFGS